MARPRSSLRLVFDENLPWRVSAALRQLEYDTSWVGDAERNAPDRGSSDEVILNHAIKTNRLVATSNHDMILLCVKMEQSVVWIDLRGRQIKRKRMVILIMEAIDKWVAMLRDSTGPVCIHAMLTKSEVINLSSAEHLVRQRMTSARRRSRKQISQPPGPLFPHLPQ